jgi:hypothetical protein
LLTNVNPLLATFTSNNTWSTLEFTRAQCNLRCTFTCLLCYIDARLNPSCPHIEEIEMWQVAYQSGHHVTSCLGPQLALQSCGKWVSTNICVVQASWWAKCSRCSTAMALQEFSPCLVVAALRNCTTAKPQWQKSEQASLCLHRNWLVKPSINFKIGT